MEHKTESIILKGMKQNNLKGIDLVLPKNNIIIFTGVSGSGKSSIVFDTIANEAGRQLNQTYSTFVQGFLPNYKKPDVESIQNLSPAFIVDQKRLGGNVRSTLGTRTDIYSLLRLLYSRIAIPFVGYSYVYSFNDPEGMCQTCHGLGKVVEPDVDKIIDMSKSLNDGAVLFSSFAKGTWQYNTFAETGYFDKDLPLDQYPEELLEKLLYGFEEKVLPPFSKGGVNSDYEGILHRFHRLYIARDLSQHSETSVKKVSGYTTMTECKDCSGKRLNPKSLSSTIHGKSIDDAVNMELTDLLDFLRTIDHYIAKPIIEEMSIRLQNLIDMKLEYLTLSRETSTLSGGESQRIKVVQYLNSSLNNILYIFDEPSIGLHPRDVKNLNQMLIKLRDKGNTVLVVEHDADIIEVADIVVDVGPLAGKDGGKIMFVGTLKDFKQSDTLTAQYLKRKIPIIQEPRTSNDFYHIRNASMNNLKNVSVDIPKGTFTVVTGVAGSGKSSLILGEFIKQHPESIVIDQSALHQSSRSNLATYTKILTVIRNIFAKEHKVNKSLFSFNASGGCDNCKGKGYIGTELAFMGGVRMTCPVCDGTQYKKEVLQYKLGGYNIVDILQLTVTEALEFFKSTEIKNTLLTLEEVGLGYLTLGQMMDTLSGGERQRIKLASELHKSGHLYILDEPTTGLHMANVSDLMSVLQKLVDNGSTVIVIEHNIEVMKQADWLIDLGPEAGKRGGEIMYSGLVRDMPSDVSITAEYLSRV